MDSKTLSTVVQSMTYEEVVAQLAPLLGKYSRWRIPGMEREDVYQELLVTLWRVHNVYDPAKGGFLTVLIRSFENTLGKMARKARQHLYPAEALVCLTAGCGETKPLRLRGGTCSSCGGTRWDAVRRPNGLVSMDQEVGDGTDSLADLLADPDVDLEDDVVMAETMRSAMRAYPVLVGEALDGDKTAIRRLAARYA